MMAAGTQLGPYELLSLLGAGGMGEVYRAKDARLNREVAIKVLPAHLATDRDALARFEREAKAVAALSHPNILTIYDIGTEQGVSFAVMELLEGETLRSRMARAPLHWREVVEIGGAMADGLFAAHAKGIIHRDLKPENIFLTSDGRVKILDFGLARMKPPISAQELSSAPTNPGVTTPGMVMGTVGYMSPEQVRGEEANAPSDIFSFGCVLYEMIAGRRVFARQTAAETMAAILKDEPPSIVESGKDVPRELESVIRRCLAKHPTERFQSTRDLGAALREMLSGSISAPSASAPAQTRLRPARWMSAAAFLLLLAAGWYFLSGRAQTIDSLAVLPLANGSGDPQADYLSDGITESLINSLSQLPKLKVMARTTVFSYKSRAMDPIKVGRELGVRAVLTGRVVERGGALIVQADLINVADGSQLWGEQYNRKLADILTVQEEISREISEKLRLKLSGEEKKLLTRRYTENTEAYQLYLKGRYYWNMRTDESYQKAIAYFQQAIDKDPGYALAYTGLADSRSFMSSQSLSAPSEAMPLAKAAAIRALQLDETLAEAHTSLAYIKLYYDWDWAGAEREYRRAIELNPSYATPHHGYGYLLISSGRMKEALAEIQKAEELDRLSLLINTDHGEFFYFARQPAQAIAQLKKALAMDPTFVRAHFLLGRAYVQNGQCAEAMAEFQKSRSLVPGSTEMLAALGQGHAWCGTRAEAQQVLEQLREMSKQRYVSPHWFAATYAALGDKEQAFEWLDKAFEQRFGPLIYLKVNPIWEPLRADPRFAAMVRRVGLTP